MELPDPLAHESVVQPLRFTGAEQNPERADREAGKAAHGRDPSDG